MGKPFASRFAAMMRRPRILVRETANGAYLGGPCLPLRCPPWLNRGAPTGKDPAARPGYQPPPSSTAPPADTPIEDDVVSVEQEEKPQKQSLVEQYTSFLNGIYAKIGVPPITLTQQPEMRDYFYAILPPVLVGVAVFEYRKRQK